MPAKREAADKAWIQELLAKHEGPLLRYVTRLLGDTERARDVVQDAFLRLLKAKRSEVADHAVEWLFTVCRNRAIDVRRKDGRLGPLDEEHIPAIGSVPPPLMAMEEKENRRQLVHALQQLPERQREVVRLKFQNGLSYREISRITGLSESNVGYLIHTAIKAMREQALSDTSAVGRSEGSASEGGGK